MPKPKNYDQDIARALERGDRVLLADGREGVVTGPPYQGAVQVRVDRGYSEHIHPTKIAKVIERSRMLASSGGSIQEIASANSAALRLIFDGVQAWGAEGETDPERRLP
jgi:hypothetical protein